MGIYDREYYRREGYSVLASFTERGRMCKWIIGITVAAFVIQMATTQHAYVRDEDGVIVGVRQSSPFTDALELNAPAVLHGEVWRLLTYAFLHGGMMHILFNMLFLWWFGSDVE